MAEKQPRADASHDETAPKPEAVAVSRIIIYQC